MKSNIVVEVPVSSRKVIQLPPPCTYCGKQIEPGTQKWKTKVIYTLWYWGIGKKFGNIALWETKNNDGVVQKGHVSVHAPYCAQHVEGVEQLTCLIWISIAVGLIASAIFGVRVFFSGGGFDWGDAVGFIGVVLFGGSIGYLVGWVITWLITLIKPEFRDYQITGNGHWGLEVSGVRVDGGVFQVGPVNYFLPLGFLNVESAQRFLAAYPDAKVIKGEKLIPNNSSAM